MTTSTSVSSVYALKQYQQLVEPSLKAKYCPQVTRRQKNPCDLDLDIQ